jgi:DNA-binding response OmpR family regulator
VTPALDEGRGYGRRVLVIEDDRFLRRLCETTLGRRGFVVLTAADGEAGIHLARTHRPDLVLLDLFVPKIVGQEVLRLLKAEASTRSIPVLVLSNTSRQREIDEVMQLGAIGFLSKANLSLCQLGDRVAALLASSSGSPVAGIVK